METTPEVVSEVRIGSSSRTTNENILRKKCLGILSGVDANFHRMLKVPCVPETTLDPQLAESLSSTMRLQNACLARVIQDSVRFLESNRKSFSDDFVDHNVSAFRFWQECFSGPAEAEVSQRRVRSALESFMLFLEFYRSLDSVLASWPVPVGFSYPRSTDELDRFLDLLPVPPRVAYSLGYRPKLSRTELRSVVLGEYRKAQLYLSAHLESVEKTLLAHFRSESEACAKLKDKIQRRTRKLFLPVQAKLEEFRRKTEEVEKTVYGLDLQAERTYASQQILVAETLVRSLNHQLQKKVVKYLAQFHLESRTQLASFRNEVRLRFQSRTSEAESTKSALLDLLVRWEETLDDALDLNRIGVLEMVTNVHQVQEELRTFLDSP